MGDFEDIPGIRSVVLGGAWYVNEAFAVEVDAVGAWAPSPDELEELETWVSRWAAIDQRGGFGPKHVKVVVPYEFEGSTAAASWFLDAPAASFQDLELAFEVLVRLVGWWADQYRQEADVVLGRGDDMPYSGFRYQRGSEVSEDPDSLIASNPELPPEAFITRERMLEEGWIEIPDRAQHEIEALRHWLDRCRLSDSLLSRAIAARIAMLGAARTP